MYPLLKINFWHFFSVYKFIYIFCGTNEAVYCSNLGSNEKTSFVSYVFKMSKKCKCTFPTVEKQLKIGYLRMNLNKLD